MWGGKMTGMGNQNKIEVCRICRADHLVPVLDLGDQCLTGVFPRSLDMVVPTGPLALEWCANCGLVQLGHSFDPAILYGDTYGYRSGLNQSMARHLADKVRRLKKLVSLEPNDVVLDIGSNDGTLLDAYGSQRVHRIGMDPVGAKFAEYYSDDITLVPDFFSASAYRRNEKRDAKIVTSIAMFYDVANPIAFAQEVERILAPDGIWHLEQSYMPSMLRLNSYDTVCHEHLEYYSLANINRILESADLKIVDVFMNAVNGGSFAVTATKKTNASIKVDQPVIDWLMDQERRMGLNTPRPFRDFEEKVFRHREDLSRLIRELAKDGKKVLGYGASTKGNVVLQFCDLGPKEIPAIAEINPDKYGSYTPGTRIPIVSEGAARRMNPDYYLVLPWHFKSGIIERERNFLAGGGRLIFPFPEIEIV
jgi:hypothetical protein